MAKIFAVDLFAFAVMSNHYHVVVRIDPKRVKKWTDHEVAKRWINRRTGIPSKLQRQLVEELKANPKMLEKARNRLGNLSWFMRYINEPLARISNAEDSCTGRFWEGRFKSVALLDITALINCMVYVDLNPNRANKKIALPSAHTSALIRHRGRSKSLASLDEVGVSKTDYLKLLRWTAASKFPDKTQRAKPPRHVLSQFAQTESQWLTAVTAHSRWYRAYGLPKAIEKYVRKIGQRWIKMPELRFV